MVVVTLDRLARRWTAVLLLTCALVTADASAAVVASIDRGDVELNESFTLDVTVDTAIDLEPDVSALEKEFYILSRSELRNTTIVNGQISRNRTWTYVLMAKEAGQFTIPPVIVGTEQSDPIPITISPVQAVLPGESDVFVVAEVDYPETWVRAQVLYRVKVYRAVATRQPRLSEPDISGVDVLVELAAEERSYDSIIDGKNYDVVERVYALFPQASGELHIAPALFEARVLRDGRITGRKIFKSEPIDVEVLPIPAPPANHPDAAWFPAKSVELREEWSRAPEELPAGEPITRRISIAAVGQLSTQLPVIDPVEPGGMKIYPDKPELRVATVPAGVLATRTEQYAMIAVDPGEIRLPALELPWWDVEAGRWQVASLPARMLRVSPSADVLPKAAAAAPAAAAQDENPPGRRTSDAWRGLSVGLACLWVATVLGWRRSLSRAARTAQADRQPAPVAPRKRSLLRAARLAAERCDARETKTALLEWARLEWPERPPLSIAELAARLPASAGDELRRLSDFRYGPDRRPWDGAGLARTLASMKLEGADRGRVKGGLPPLMPQT